MTITIAVDMDTCQGHRQCCLAVPEVFRLGEGKVRYVPVAEDALGPELEAAAAHCPTMAISIRRSGLAQ